MIPQLLLFLQENGINEEAMQEKLNNAPKSYQIAHLVGSYLPYALLILIAYFMYRSAKNSDNPEK